MSFFPFLYIKITGKLSTDYLIFHTLSKIYFFLRQSTWSLHSYHYTTLVIISLKYHWHHRVKFFIWIEHTKTADVFRLQNRPPTVGGLLLPIIPKSNKKKNRGKNTKHTQIMLWIIFEGLLPLGIILAILTITGNVQYHIHKAVHGRLKHVGNDMRDMVMERMDKKLIE